MQQFNGKSVLKKIAIGKAYYYEKKQSVVKRRKIEDIEQELSLFDQARKTAQQQLELLRQKAEKEAGEAESAIFEIHIMMLEDDDYCDSVYNMIRSQQINAEYAVASTGDNFSKMFADMDDNYMKERAVDVKDVSERVINILTGNSSDMTDLNEPVILIADDLTPSETVQLDKSKLLGFVTRIGSSNSHTAILARTMGIPALIGVDISSDWHSKLAVIDGYEGSITIEPDEKYLEKAKKLLEEDKKKSELLKQLKGKETVTRSGKKINLYANIGSVADVGIALLNDAEGIGLFRSEFLYLESKDYPDENEQFVAYKTVAENMTGKKVIIRTLDIGADKQVDYFNLDKEENPALGYRAIRICLTNQEVFKTQLRAIYRASAFGNISIMLPMIISIDEVLRAKAIMEEVKRELRALEIEFRDIEVGVMIETPASVMISEDLAKEVDFFSIGTNDLTQYTLAIDRQNERLDPFYDPHHPAILKMIQIVVENAHKAGIWAGICGELGADTELTEQFIKMGIDELSVSPGYLLSVRKVVRDIE